MNLRDKYNLAIQTAKGFLVGEVTIDPAAKANPIPIPEHASQAR